MAGIREGQGQLVFGLDIGTRSIVGTVGYLNGEKFHVVAQRSREHETRSMLDGQIHDIAKVGQTISIVKRQLEEDIHRELSEVCIAAAGRVLRTVTTHVEQVMEEEKEITDEDVYELSTKGIEQAYEEFQRDNDSELKFYCVGYTPIRYFMNGYQITNLVGHKAKNISLNMIATFLPDDVVDGLYKAVEHAGLHVANLTLEPIAAIQVAIPERYRLLNMALVDVGAGTSDISITKEGTITAYGMIPMAGDSLTEQVVQRCLVDFETAEKIKRSASTDTSISYTDIMGLSQTITRKEIVETLTDTVEQMTMQVADCIRELNGDKPVSAVFVVGGGGMVPGYTEKLAEKLGIQRERVAIRGEEVMQNIVFEIEDARKDSMMVTPIGICLSYYEQSNNFIFVEFNKQRLKLYDNGRLTVADAAMQLSFSNEDLFPKRGKALTFSVNGRAKIVRGEQGEAAIIKVNNDISDMYRQITSGDIISIIPSTAGAPAQMELGALSEFGEQLHIVMNGSRIDLPKTALVNGQIENEYYKIKDNDNIIVNNYYTVREIAAMLDVPLGSNIMVNDSPANAETRVYDNFSLSFNMDGGGLSFADLPDAEEGDEIKRPPGWEEAREREEQAKIAAATGAAIAQAAAMGVDIAEVSFAGIQGETADNPTAGMFGEITAGDGRATTVMSDIAGGSGGINGDQLNAMNAAGDENTTELSPKPKVVHPITVFVNHQTVTLNGKTEYVFVDVFDYINFDLHDSRGRSIVTKLNGRNATAYMEEIHDGDTVEVYWEEKFTT